ncbi:MAG: PQQ-binding-like beta-propeller repeat protein, partial [bacterium]
VEINSAGNYAYDENGSIRDRQDLIKPINMNTESQELPKGTKLNARFNFHPTNLLTQGSHTFRVTIKNPAGLIGTATTKEGFDWIPFEIIPKPTLLWQKEFEQNIGNISMTGDGKYIVVNTVPDEFDESGRNEIYMFDRAGNIVWQHSSTEYGSGASFATISKNGNYIAVYKAIWIPGSDELVSSDLLYLDKNGNLLWRTPEEEGLPEDFSLSDDGEYILMSAPTGNFFASLYNKNGEKLWEKLDLTLELMAGAPIISGDGNYILIFNQLFDKRSNLLWEKDRFIGSGISNNGNIIVGEGYNARYSSIQSFNPSGNLLGEYSCKDKDEIPYPILSWNGDYIVASTNNGDKVYFLDNKCSLLWEKVYSCKEGEIIPDVRPFSIITDDGKYCAVAYRNVSIDILNQSGNVVGQINFESEVGKTGWGGEVVMLWSTDGRYLAVTERRGKLYLYDNSNIIK